MDVTNPFETPTTLLESKLSGVAPLSTVVCSIIGGLVGLGLGVLGVIALCYFVQGMLGVAEILILVGFVFTFLVVPGVAVGASIGAFYNRKK